jgi:hypothetical protein
MDSVERSRTPEPRAYRDVLVASLRGQVHVSRRSDGTELKESTGDSFGIRRKLGSPPKTRRKHIHVGSLKTSLFFKVLGGLPNSRRIVQKSTTRLRLTIYSRANFVGRNSNTLQSFATNRLFFASDIIQHPIQTIAFRNITRFILQSRLNRLRHYFTQFNTELVKCIDIPDHTLNKYFVLI